MSGARPREGKADRFERRFQALVAQPNTTRERFEKVLAFDSQGLDRTFHAIGPGMIAQREVENSVAGRIVRFIGKSGARKYSMSDPGSRRRLASWGS